MNEHPARLPLALRSMRVALCFSAVLALATGCGTAAVGVNSDPDGADLADVDAAGLDVLATDAAGGDTGGTDAADSDATGTDGSADAQDAATDASTVDGTDAADAGADEATGLDAADAATPDAAVTDAIEQDAVDAADDSAADVPVDVYTGCTSTEGCSDADPFTVDACGAAGLCTHTPAASYTTGLTTGPAAGALVTVPAGAIDASVVLTVQDGTTIDNPGATAAGPAVQFGPGGTQFLAPVTVTLPYDPLLVAVDSELVVLRREDDTQEVTALTPVDIATALVSVQTSSFSTFQPYSVPKPKVLTFTADETSLPSLGGTVHLKLTLQNAQTVALTALPVAGVILPVLTPTTTAATVQLPPNLDPTLTKVYTLTLIAKGATGATPAQASVQVTVLPNPKETFTKVVSGWGHFLALTPDGHVACWGGNVNGQCVIPDGLADVKDIAASATASIAVKKDGTIVQWGDIGTPYSAMPTGGVASVAGGETHFLAAMTDGTVQAWTSYDNWGVAVVPAGLTDVVAVAAGDSFSLALKKDGTVVGWGSDGTGAISGGMALTGVTSIAAGRATALFIQASGQATFFGYEGGGAYPAPKAAALADTKAVATSGRTSCVLKNDGTLLLWASDSKYSFLYGPAGDSGFTTVAAGIHYCVGLKADGSIATYQVDGPGNARMPFAALGLTDAVAISIGQQQYGTASLTNSHTLALRANGTVVAWSNTGTDACGESEVPAGLTDVIAVASGGQHSLALKKDGTVVGWGCTAAAIVPADVTGITAIDAGGDFSIALRANGTIAVWGDGPYNYMWDPLISYNPPPAAVYCSKPCATEVQPTGAVGVNAGGVAGMALLKDGTLSAWGKLFVNAASAPAGLQDVVAMDTAGVNAIALKKDGTIALWGLNYSDPGDPTPQQVTDAIAVAVGSSWHTADGNDAMPGAQWYAVRKDGTLWASGRNLMGTTTAAKKVTGAVTITAGEWEGAVTRFDGTVQAWGMMAINAR